MFFHVLLDVIVLCLLLVFSLSLLLMGFFDKFAEVGENQFIDQFVLPCRVLFLLL